jgi:hypothetical protein
MDKIKSFGGIAICVVTSGRPVDIRWAMNLPTLAFPVGMSIGWFGTKGSDRAANREKLVEEAIKVGSPYIFFMDDDTIVPNFTLRSLHAEIEKDPSIMVCGGIYCTKEEIPAPLVFKVLGGGPFYQWKVGEVFECAGLGTGCMLIKTEVFQHLSKPWFFEPDEHYIDQTVDLNGITCPLSASKGTDDLFFCRKVSEAGFKIMAHGGVLPVHLDQEGKIYTLPLDSYPCRGAGLRELKQTEGEPCLSR